MNKNGPKEERVQQLDAKLNWQKDLKYSCQVVSTNVHSLDLIVNIDRTLVNFICSNI